MTLQNQAMLKYQNLIALKDQLETEISNLENILKANNTNMKSSLVDIGGFPRTDLDVYAVRNARSKIIQLSNDHVNALNAIEKCLQEIHVNSREKGPGSLSTFEEEKAFALVDAVAPDSPAAIAGLQRGDLILQFGDLTLKFKSTRQTFDMIGGIVNERIGVSILILTIIDGNNRKSSERKCVNHITFDS